MRRVLHRFTSFRRGYALMLAVLAAAGITSMLGLMLERQLTQRLSVARQVEAYQRHHAAKGYQEIVDSWIRSLAGRSLAPLIADGERVLTLDLGDGLRAEVTFADAQGSVLSSPAGLTGRDFERVRLMRASLPQGSRDRNAPALTRDVGPVAVSMRSAPAEVIQAAFASVADQSGGVEFAQRLLAIRAEQPIQQSDVAKTAIALGVTPEIRARLNEVLVAEPSLWFVTVELRRGSAGTVVAREGGHIVVAPRRAGRGATSGIWEKSSAFLTWQKLPIQ
ncbi:MAG: hypothetical protein KF912_04870 [Phycisphaeraceae bacterium]|nr:hypothetical protein [Phycisphaeraceae bacterium]